MDGYLHLLRIRSGRSVVLCTLLLTVLCVVAPVSSIAVLLSTLPFIPTSIYWTILAVTAAIPLLIAPPVSLVALSMLRLLTITLDRVDQHVRFDTLTGVFCRGFFLGRMRELLPAGGAFLMVDADHFKSINDNYGHDVGDETLRRLVEIIRNRLWGNALLGRLGGEEFGIFLPGADEAKAIATASRLCDAVRQQGASIAGHPVNLTISVGGCVHIAGDPLEHTMREADVALYQAKRSGRDRHCMASTSNSVPSEAPKPIAVSA